MDGCNRDASGGVVVKYDGGSMMNWEWFELCSMKPEEFRILMAWVLGDAWDDLMSLPRASWREGAFARGGCLVGLGPPSVVQMIGLRFASYCVATLGVVCGGRRLLQQSFQMTF